MVAANWLVWVGGAALALTYDVTDWLNITGRLGTDFTVNQFETRKKPADRLGLLDGFYSNELGKDNVQNNDLLITASKENLFGSKIGARLSLGGTQWSRSAYGLKAQSGRWVNPSCAPWRCSSSAMPHAIE